jgi:O-antigen ligase
MRFFGSAHYGGRNYFFVLAAIAGYYAFTSQRIPVARAPLYVGLFFLSGFVALLPNIAYAAGGHLDFLFYVFPAEMAIEQAMADYRLDATFGRIYGLTLASLGLYCWVLSRYGIRGLFDSKRPWRLLLLGLAFAGCLLSGFRSSLLLFLLVIAVQMLFEGLFRPRMLAAAGAVILLGAVIVLPHTDRLPLVVQRSISFLPVPIDPTIRQSADNSSQWRLDMWKAVLPEVPRYLLKGKGYAYDPLETEFADENSRRGYDQGFTIAMLVGDYHSGPLSVLIPFGIWGVLAFGWFVLVSVKYLYQNYRHGAPALRQINLFLFTYFVARVVFFLLIFGAFNYEFFVFTGLVGLSASLNGASQAEPAAAPAQIEAAYDEEFAAEELR